MPQSNGDRTHDAPGPDEPSARDGLAAALARTAGRVLRVTGAGAGSALPGLVVERASPGYLRRRAAALTDGIVAVSGTNGKTTTSSMLRAILRAEGIATVGNESGSNLKRGIASAMLDAPDAARLGVLEIDEAALPALVPELRPRLVVLTNVFRDQLDRYGETETVANLLAAALRRLPSGAAVVANADDPLLWNAAREFGAVGFGLEPIAGAVGERADAEPETCPRCGARLEYLGRTIAHLGQVRCPACSWASTAPEFRGRVERQDGVSAITVEISGHEVALRLGGVHNAYNAVAAVAAASLLGVPVPRAAEALRSFAPRFGRAEEVRLDDRPAWILLMKNPAGAGVVIDEVVADARIGAVVVAVSDNVADGRDISWIWDADFERLSAAGAPLVPAGRRAADVAVRLRYAGATPLPAQADPLAAMRSAMAACAPPSGVGVLATYTAMLDLRASLTRSRRGRLEDAAR
jgi:UDP-N-acetylmuramyl tripeptide synthase